MKRMTLISATALVAAMLLPATPALAAHPVPLITTDPHSAASALARGQALLGSIALPSGVHWRTSVPRKSGPAQASQTIVLDRSASGTHAGGTLNAYFRQHPPRGLVAVLTEPITAHEEIVDYATRKSTNTSAALTYTWNNGSVAVTLEVTVGWVPLRTVDETLPATIATVDVEVGPPHSYQPGATVPPFDHQVVHATGPVVQTLVRYLNSLTPEGPFGFGAGACTEPLFYGSDPVMTFAVGAHTVVFRYVNECQLFHVTVDGKARPVLQITGDPTTLVMTRLLHLVPAP